MTETAAATARLTLQCHACRAWNRIPADRAADRPKCGKCATPIPLDHPWPLTDDTLARTIGESDLPVLVDFYADWCGPCKMMAPAVDALAQEWLGRALVAKLDTDRARLASQQYRITGIPTTMLFRNGREVRRLVGAQSKRALEELLRTA